MSVLNYGIRDEIISWFLESGITRSSEKLQRLQKELIKSVIAS
jgi:hypothetical protein